MKMKMSWMGLVLGLVLLMAVSSDACPLGLCRPDLCCYKFVTFEIPEAEIKEIVETHRDCSLHGYVFITNRGKICKKKVKKSEEAKIKNGKKKHRR